jgi:hypothetical protein
MGKTIKRTPETTQSREEMLKNIHKKHKSDGVLNAKHLEDIKHHLKATHRLDRFYGKQRINSIPDEIHGGRQKV